MKSSDQNTKDKPGVIAFPPLIYGTAILLTFLLHLWKPVSLSPMPYYVSIAVGVILFILAGFIIRSASQVMRRAATNVHPGKPTLAIVTEGVYRYSRNPMYLSLTLVFLSVGFLLYTAWTLILLIPLLVLVHYGVIKREEKYLTAKFGSQYTQYKHTVRRWI